MTGALEFVGEPFDAVAWATPTLPQTRQANQSARDLVLERLRRTIAAAHHGALRAHGAMQHRLLAATCVNPLNGKVFTTAPSAGQVTSAKPLARSATTRLGADELARLTRGDVAGVFGQSYDQDGCNPDVRLANGTNLVLDEVTAIRYVGNGRGELRARCRPGADLVEATVQAAQVFALYLGLHLCLADATFVRVDEHETRVEPAREATGTELRVDIERIDLVPRPWLSVRAQLASACVSPVSVALREKPGVPIGPALGGRPPVWGGRKSSQGERVLLNEFHLTHLSRGDQGIAFGPEFARFTGMRATRLPSGGLMLVDRVVAVDGERGRLDGGTFLTEYDSPADAWYYTDSANASMPNCVYLETSGQAALLTGYYLGATLSTPDTPMSLRMLGGTATVLREMDLRDKTIRQRSDLVATHALPGSTLQNFIYTLTAGGEPVYAGDAMFGYFSEEALANQTGLDGGRSAPTWLEAERPRVGVRTIDVAARRADPAARLCSRDHLALLDEVTVVDGGGRYGEGYLHATHPIEPDHWLFDWHFPHDPVMPGSFGIEQVIQAMQEWLLDAEQARQLREPEFIVPVGVSMSWRYRGQFLPTDGMSIVEVHLKAVEARPGRLRVTADASVWKPGLRIYEITDAAVELREKGAQPW